MTESSMLIYIGKDTLQILIHIPNIYTKNKLRHRFFLCNKSNCCISKCHFHSVWAEIYNLIHQWLSYRGDRKCHDTVPILWFLPQYCQINASWEFYTCQASIWMSKKHLCPGHLMSASVPHITSDLSCFWAPVLGLFLYCGGKHVWTKKAGFVTEDA